MIDRKLWLHLRSEDKIWRRPSVVVYGSAKRQNVKPDLALS